MRERGPDTLYPGLHLAREVGKFLLGVAYGPVESGLDGLGNAVGFFGRSGHRFPHGSTEAVRLCAHLAEIRTDVVTGIICLVLGLPDRIREVVDTISAGIGSGSYVGTDILACISGLPGIFHNIFQIVNYFLKPVYCAVKPEVHAKSQLSAVCHSPHLLLGKRKAAEELFLLRLPFCIKKYAGFYCLPILRHIHILKFGVCKPVTTKNHCPKFAVPACPADGLLCTVLIPEETAQWP